MDNKLKKIIEILRNCYNKKMDIKFYSKGKVNHLNVINSVYNVYDQLIVKLPETNGIYNYRILLKCKGMREEFDNIMYINLESTKIYYEGNAIHIETDGGRVNKNFGIIIDNYRTFLRKEKLENI